MKTKNTLISDEEMYLIKLERQKLYNKKNTDIVHTHYLENVENIKNKFWLSKNQIKTLLLTNTFTEILSWKLVNWKLVIPTLYDVDKRNIV